MEEEIWGTSWQPAAEDKSDCGVGGGLELFWTGVRTAVQEIQGVDEV